MAEGRTISAKELTLEDREVFEECEKIKQLFLAKLNDSHLKREFKETYAKLSVNRDAGAGRGGGKLQRDALCTRGMGGKAPYSNRNLRWHPLVVAQNLPSWAKPIESIKIKSIAGSPSLVFTVRHQGNQLEFPSAETHLMPDRFAALPQDWEPISDHLKTWNAINWTENSCVIKAEEACTRADSLETYALLGLIILVNYYDIDGHQLYSELRSLLSKSAIGASSPLPTLNFPNYEKAIEKCPICVLPVSNNLEIFRDSSRAFSWKPNWGSNKKSEGNDDSTQVMHVNPLVESEIRHNASNVRYGHRWCNIAMTDHTLAETLKFMKEVLTNHGEVK